MRAHDHTTRTPVEEALSAGRSRYLAFVRRRIADPDLAEDILQDSLLRALRAAPDIGDHDRIAAWFYRVLRNAVVDAYRRRDVQGRRTERLGEGFELPTCLRRMSARFASASVHSCRRCAPSTRRCSLPSTSTNARPRRSLRSWGSRQTI
jgi:DNA-directed RNA polymerase specialized sigma24 family protein